MIVSAPEFDAEEIEEKVNFVTFQLRGNKYGEGSLDNGLF
jgi:hypothetical protein